jgi:hypothetical protein
MTVSPLGELTLEIKNDMADIRTFYKGLEIIRQQDEKEPIDRVTAVGSRGRQA